MLVVYIAGKFRADTPWKVEQNIRVAEEHALAVWKMGVVALCPHTNTRFFDKSLPDEAFLKGTLELLYRSDVVLAIPGWDDREGATAEVLKAQDRGMPVFFSLESLSQWLFSLR